MDDCKKCNSKYTVCFRGKCVCKPGFVGDGKYCIPILKGNFELHFCLLNIFSNFFITQSVTYNGIVSHASVIKGLYKISNTMIASDSFVLRGNVNLVFPSLLMQEGNFPFVF